MRQVHRRCRAAGQLIAVTAILVMLPTAAARAAATFTVTTTADTGGGTCISTSCSLRQALAAANNGDTVVVPAGTYALINGQLPMDTGVTLIGAGPNATILLGSTPGERVMRIFGNGTAATLEHLTVTGGTLTGPGGGGIAIGGPGPVVLDDVAVTGNSVTPASDAFNEGGGGVFSLAPLTVTDSTISDNTVDVTLSDGDSGGGGILMAAGGGDLTLDDSVVSGNTATVTANPGGETTDNNGGGGLYMDAGDLSITDSNVSDNTATVTGSFQPAPADGGGGIYQYGDRLTLDRSTVSGNTADGPGVDKGGGGGVFDGGDSSEYLDSTIAGNTAGEPATTSPPDTDGGGGVLLDNLGGGVTMANMTITGNSAPAAAGGGINNNLGTDVTIADSILAGNTAGSGGANCDSQPAAGNAIVSAGYNLTDDPAGANSCSLSANGDLVATSPGLGPLTDNGGPAPTEAVLAGSPAIAAGNPAGCTDLVGDPIATDERGVARPQPTGGRCDIGAYERALPAVTTGAATVNGSAVQMLATVSDADPRAGSVVFQYGPTAAYGATTTSQVLPGSAAAEQFAAAVSGLTPGTYHYRATATGPDGTTNGADGVFTISAPVTAAAAPSVVTGRATRVGELRAILHGAVGPQGQATSIQFEYGTTRRLGTITRLRSVGSGSTAVAVHAAVTGLAAGRTYYARLVAVNATGSTDGSEIRFRTAARARPRTVNARVRPGRDRRPPFALTITGKLTLPAGIGRSRGCRGAIAVTARIGHARVGSARAVVGRACRYRIRVRLHGRRLRAAGRVRLVVRFRGNAVLVGRSAAPLEVRYG